MVWEQWNQVAPRDRESIIREAYERYDRGVDEDRKKHPKLTLVLGVTADEAFRNHLLPYGYFPSIDQSDPRFGDLCQIMKRAHAVESRSQGVRLAFPTREMADEAYRRVKFATDRAMPDVSWVPVQDHGPNDED